MSQPQLDLRAPDLADLDELHALHADARVWTHFPSGRHVDIARTRRELEGWIEQWEADGLGYWVARWDGEVVGIGGCARPPGQERWNVYYRISPASQGRGFAVELARSGMARAREVAPDRPITAFLLEHNAASRATAIRIGLTEIWHGTDAGNPDPHAVRLVFADRPLGPELIEQLMTT